MRSLAWSVHKHFFPGLCIGIVAWSVPAGKVPGSSGSIITYAHNACILHSVNVKLLHANKETCSVCRRIMAVTMSKPASCM